MKQETKDAIRGILRKAVSCEIPINWRTTASAHGGAGSRKSRSRGSNGYDLAARLTYEPGDDPRDIDWAATAQTGGQEILTVQFYDPRDTKFFVLVDTKTTMDFGTHRTTKRVLAAELTASIIKSAEETNDKIGFVAYSEDRVEKYYPSKSAKMNLVPALAATLESNSPEERAAGRKAVKSEKGVSGLVKALSRLPKSRSLVFVLSDFFDLSEEDKKALRRAGTIHDIVCLVIQDRRERELPAGWGFYTLQDMRTGVRRTIWLSRSTRQKFQENFQRHNSALLALFKKAHCDWSVFSTEEGAAAHPKLMRLFGGHRR